MQGQGHIQAGLVVWVRVDDRGHPVQSSEGGQASPEAGSAW